ncbi:sprouty-related, EVH1 domain-containing protein 1-like isoform X5 [Eriocheir sinensis]|nr:sprouty-related, EVH1 domain-containing protein 1-like isoform X5 [Eriocheir sinensis]
MHFPLRASSPSRMTHGNYLVRVRAQVMMRDDSTGGWVPMGGGGLSNVSVRKRFTHPDLDDSKYEYIIYGKRISDQTVVLSCTIIIKDFQYYKVMPTFHHWKTGDMKFGLTFQTAADARAFDNGVRLALDDLLEGLNDIPSYRHGPDSEKVFV